MSTPWPFGLGSQAPWTGFACYAFVGLTLLTFTQQLAGAPAEKLRVEADQAAVREGALRSRLEAAEAAAAWGQVERHLQELTDALPVKISLVSRDLRYQYVNHA